MERGLWLSNDDTLADMHPRGQRGWHRITGAWLYQENGRVAQIKNEQLYSFVCAKILCLAINT